MILVLKRGVWSEKPEKMIDIQQNLENNVNVYVANIVPADVPPQR